MRCLVGRSSTVRLGSRMLTLIACLFLVSGCATIKMAVNKTWPPMNLNAATEEASSRALDGLTKMARADLYIGVSDDDIKTHAPRTIMNADSRIRSIDLELDRQAILFDVYFDGIFVEQKFRAGGQIKVAAVPSISGTALRVRPVARYVHLDRLQLDKDSPLRIMKEQDAVNAINFLLNTFIDNINGQLSVYETNLAFGSSAILRPEQVLGGLPGANNFTGKPYQVKSEMEVGSVLIDQQGLHALVQSQLTRSEVDPSDLAADVVVNQLSASSSYDTFNAAFRAFGRQHVGNDLDNRWQNTAAAASDKFVAAIVNMGIQPISFGADFAIAPQAGSFNELLEIHTTWDFDCSSGMNCSINDHCNDLARDCSPGWNCPSCEWYQVDCHARRLGCEADKVRFRLQCNIENGTRIALCNANQAAKIAACEVVKAAKRVGCELNKAFLQLVNGMDIGRFSGDYFLQKTTGNVFLNEALITGGIQDIKLDTTLTARSEIALNSQFEPYDLLGHLACILPTNFNLKTPIGIKAQKLSLLAHRISSEVVNDELSIKYRTEPQKLTISTDELPMLKLTLLNPEFLIKCNPLAKLVTVGTIFKKFREDLLRSDYEIEIKPFDFAIGIPHFDVPVFDGNIAFHPQQTDGALWFEGISAPKTAKLQSGTMEAIR